MIRKMAITAAAVFGFMVLGSSVPAKALDSCDRRISKAEDNLRKDIHKHGEYSSQAQYRRRQLAQAREQCGRERYRQPASHRWTDRDHDRDRREHDRDHDRREHDKDRDRHKHDKDHDHDHDHDGR